MDRLTVIDPRRTFVARCWFCDGPLPPCFTSVRKNGIDLRVHFGCAPEAEDYLAQHVELVTLPVG